MIAFVFAAAVTALSFLVLKFTRLGKAIRATSQSREVAMVCGVDVGRIHMLTFGFASALAAAGGALLAVIVAIQPEMGGVWTFKSFLVIVLGGAGNYPAARQRRQRPGPAGARGRRRRPRPRRRHRLPVPAAQGAVLCDRDARPQRGAARARVLLRGADGRRQWALAADARRQGVDLLRHGRAGDRGDRDVVADRDLTLRAAADDDPRGRGRRGGDGHRHLPPQAGRAAALRRRPRRGRRAHGARPGLHRADQRVPASHHGDDDRDGALRGQGLGVRSRAGRRRALRRAGDRVGALSLRPPAAFRRHHRRRRAADAARRARPAPAALPAAEDDLMRAGTLGGAGMGAAFGLLVMVLLVRSLPWPLVQDAPVMHYIAWRIGEGDVPYRDLYDINQPGVYVLHLALLRTLGAGDGAWRAFDLAWLAATAGAVALLAARWGAVAAPRPALAFAAYHLAGGAWQAGPPGFLLCGFFVVRALGGLRWLERRGGGRGRLPARRGL